MRLRVLTIAVVSAIVLASCGLGDGDGTVTPPTGDDGGSVTTNAPEMTAAPDTTAAPDGESADDSTPWWLLILVGVGFVILLIALVSRGSKEKVVVATAAPTWKESARRGYADARWLHDAMTEDLAIWRGNATADHATAAAATAGTAKAATWAQLETRVASASDHLYALEAAAPDQRTGQAASGTITTMHALRASIDARAESRANYRSVQAQAGGEASALGDAREREVRSSQNLAEARSAFGQALTDLSRIV